MRVRVAYDERYWYPDEGGAVWLAGYSLVDPGSGRYLARDDPELGRLRLLVTGVAGAGRHHGEELQSEAASPGRPLVLRRDPANEADPNAVAVDTVDGEQVGWVPRELAAGLAPQLDGGERWSAVVLREQRASPRDLRSGLTMLLAPAESIEIERR